MAVAVLICDRSCAWIVTAQPASPAESVLRPTDSRLPIFSVIAIRNPACLAQVLHSGLEPKWQCV
eukprot:9897037-Heterocapsa_arctica.AAC.1